MNARRLGIRQVLEWLAIAALVILAGFVAFRLVRSRFNPIGKTPISAPVDQDP